MSDKRNLRQKYSRLLQGAVNTDDLRPGDEPMCNHSNNPTFADVLHSRLQRRQMLKGSLALAVTSMFAGPALNGLRPQPAEANPGRTLLGFKPIPVSEADTIVVPEGYTARTILPWGEPITGSYPAYRLENTGAQQGMQVGMHHDGMHFFPIEGRDPYQGSSTDGLMVMNHEYVEPRFLHKAAIGMSLDSDAPPMQGERRAADEVLKEINAHGVSVVRIRQQANGSWAVQRDGRNRRITGMTPMELRGPVRGSDLVKTKYSPNGTRTRGTLNNCAHGVTPWNTYLTCEENWAGYFVNNDSTTNPQGERVANLPREHRRYGLATGRSRFGWERANPGLDQYARFDASTKAASPTQDYRNEPNTFGYVVEIDPFNPNSTPVKHTALGRFAHEGVVFQTPVEGQPIVCYSGDDARFEYVYKYVSAQPYRRATASGALLDEGTLYVAKFNADGAGEWVALVHGQNGLTAANGFKDQADVLVNTRAAADFVGATKMDRPEWGAVDPSTGDVYFTMTNNSRRTAEQVDAANPRPENRWGQIVRWSETGNNPAATTFQWDMFVLAGPETDSRKFSGQSLTAENIFACPDGLWFDADRRLWIQTDIGESEQNKGDFVPFGNNQMLAANPVTGEIRRFLTGPVGQEITGVITTPDQRTMFINVQHPGATTPEADFAAGKVNSRWPDGNPAIYPRSATVVITKNDGGIIGS
ncbi:PhoX family protein [Leptolyngbya sp. KIOST-1]|uniref:PhoX family protein n=1 Tax=Leptolyngbya sp. KIOST-1 TaxID=1229172 RepID=UPI00068E56A9|nr:PhoX family phosphatase [Leptolyngbya sp. KIOST-1]